MPIELVGLDITEPAADVNRTMSQAEHPDDDDSSDDDLAEGVVMEDSAASSETAAKAEQLQELQLVLQEDMDLMLQNNSGDSLSSEASYQHLNSVDPAAVAGHPGDEQGQNIPDITDPGLASTANGLGEQLQALQLDPGHAAASGDSAPHLSAAPEAAQPPVPGQPSAIRLDLGKAREMALANFDAADPSILNAGLPEDYKRSPTQSKVPFLHIGRAG